MQISPNIFREYDIRGLVDTELTEPAVSAIAKAFGTYAQRAGKKILAVGHDVRHSSDRYNELVIEGLTSTGCDVIDIGLVPTPLLYFSLFQLPVDGGVMVTASHNPSEYNGLKLCIGKETIYGQEIQKLKGMVEKEDYMKGSGTVQTFPDIIPRYMEHVKKNIEVKNPIRAVLDCGNGTAGLVAPELVRSLGCHAYELFSTPDGNFPNHHPDPTVPENLKELIATVKRERAHVGLAYDGDSDRLGVVDDQGNILWGDQLLIIFSREILARKPGSTIIFEVKCSKTLPEDIRKNGGNPIMWKAGHSLIKNKMKETNAAAAGEMSGHLFFADEYYGYDDAIYASARLLRILSHTNTRLSEFLKNVRKTYSTPEIRVDCPDDRKFQVVEEVKQYYQGKYPIIDVDGVRVDFGDGWGLVRASNTQPALVLRFEADREKRLEQIHSDVHNVVRSVMKST
jgi:phosphomannomutase/phosphoglucomutase